MGTGSPFQAKRRLWYLESQLSNYLEGECLPKTRLVVGRVVVEERDVVGLESARRKVLSTGHRQREASLSEGSPLPCSASDSEQARSPWVTVGGSSCLRHQAVPLVGHQY